MSGIRFSPRPNKAHLIEWHPWDSDAFERAKAGDLPILLSISATWCHWCHVMDETSFSDDEARKLINEGFVAVRVDSDQRPDVNSRYNMGGWPSVAFLTPDGDLISGCTYVPPQQFGDLLKEVAEAYKGNGEALRRKAGELRGAQSAPRITASTVQLDGSIVEGVVRAVEESYDPQHGGFGTQPKFPDAAALELLLHRHRVAGDSPCLGMVEHTLERMMSGGLYDAEEEGFYRYSTNRDWSVPHYEKMLESNLGLVQIYLHAYIVTGSEKYADVASRVLHYLDRYLYNKDAGMFYGSQDADEEYYALTLQERKKMATPGVDTTFYTNLNSIAACTYLEAAWVLNQPKLTDIALGVMGYLLQRWRGGNLCHFYTPEGEVGIPALFSDYAHLLKAVVVAYRHTSRQEYLEQAEQLARQMRDIFWDQPGEGFFDIAEEPEALAALGLRRKLIGDNAVAAEALVELFNVTQREEYRQLAEGALRAFAGGYEGYGEAAASCAVAVDRILHPRVEISVVGPLENSQTQAMVRAAANIPYPHIVVKASEVEPAGLNAPMYGQQKEPLAYVCMNTMCLPPISDPQELARAVAEFLKPAAEGFEIIQL